MENETHVAAGRAPVKRFFGAVTIALSLFGCLAFGLLIAFGISLSKARAQQEFAQAEQAKLLYLFDTSRHLEAQQEFAQAEQAKAAQAYQANLVRAVPSQNPQNQPQRPQYSSPYPTSTTGINPVPAKSPTSVLDAEVQRLAIALRSAHPELRERLNQELVTKLTESFDARQKSHISQLGRLRGEVQKTQELIEKREKLKSQIIERRIKELTGQPDELGWDPVAMSGTDAPSTQSARPLESPYGFPSSPYFQAPNYQVPSTTPPPPGFPYSSLPPNNIPQSSVPSIEVSSTIPSEVARFEPVPLQPEPNVNIPFATEPGSVLPTFIPSSNEPSIVPKSDGSGIASNSTAQTSQRSFITIGFRLKQLLKELADENAINQIPNPSRHAIQLQSSIDETRAGWDFEKLQFKNNLDLIDLEQRLVQRQLENAQEVLDQVMVLASKGAESKSAVSKAEDQRSEIERQLLQLRSRSANLKQSFDWMNEFEKASLKPQAVSTVQSHSRQE